MTLLTQTLGDKQCFDPDYIFDNAALANGGATTSAAFEFGGDLLGQEIVGYADTEITIASPQTIIYTLTTSDTYGGSYTLSDTIVTKSVSTIASGTELFRFAGNTKTKKWAKVVCTTTADQSLDKHTVILESVPR